MHGSHQYLLGEAAHASGVIAAVAAGLAMATASRNQHIEAATRVQAFNVWEFAQIALNGSIFVLIGEQLPTTLRSAARNADSMPEKWSVAAVIVLVCVGLVILRFGFIRLPLTLVRADEGSLRVRWPDRMRLMGAFSIAGVRGAVTLAGILTLPLTLADGTPIPGRSLAVAIAAAVVLISLITASVALPSLLTGIKSPANDDSDIREDALRLKLVGASATAIDNLELLDQGTGIRLAAAKDISRSILDPRRYGLPSAAAASTLFYARAARAARSSDSGCAGCLSAEYRCETPT